MAEEEGRWELHVSRIPWDPTGYVFSGSDYLMSMVLDIPEMFYVPPSGQIAFVYVWGRGLVRLHHDFTTLDQEQISLLINAVRRDLQ